MKINIDFISSDEALKNRGLQIGGEVQWFVDKEVISCSDKYVPVLKTNLKKSGTLGTKLGSGLVVYNAPYAHRQYYHNKGMGKQGMNKAKGTRGLRGAFWFKRMKNDHLDDIIDGAKKIVGGK